MPERHEPAHWPLGSARRNPERVPIDGHDRGRGQDVARVTMYVMHGPFNTEPQRGELVIQACFAGRAGLKNCWIEDVQFDERGSAH